MGMIADRVLMLVVRLSESDASAGEYPFAVFILLTFCTSYALEQGCKVLRKTGNLFNIRIIQRFS